MKDTIEMKVHHLRGLKSYLFKDEQKAEPIFEGLKMAGREYVNDDTTEKDLYAFALSIKRFYDTIMEGNHKIRLIASHDKICGTCPIKETKCDTEAVDYLDNILKEPAHFDVEIGKDYSLSEILEILYMKVFD